MKVKLSALFMSTMLLGSVVIMPKQVGMADTITSATNISKGTQRATSNGYDQKGTAYSDIFHNPIITVKHVYNDPMKIFLPAHFMTNMVIL